MDTYAGQADEAEQEEACGDRIVGELCGHQRREIERYLGIELALAVLAFGTAQALATVCAIAWNFVLNNLFTYRDQRLSGLRFVTGLIRFEVICAIGAISNVGIATWIYDYDDTWWIAGLGGALIGTVWNFVVSAALVWRQR